MTLTAHGIGVVAGGATLVADAALTVAASVDASG